MFQLLVRSFIALWHASVVENEDLELVAAVLTVITILLFEVESDTTHHESMVRF